MKTNQLDQFLDLNEHFNLIHPLLRPEQVRVGDPIRCRVHISTNEIQEVRLWSYCPFGFEIEIDSTDSGSLPNYGVFEIVFGEETYCVEGTQVFSRSSINAGKTLIGIRTHYEIRNNNSSLEERRATSRWMCPEHLLPTGTAANPIRYNDYIFFRIVDVSSAGLKIVTSLRNKFVSVGQVLEATLSIPMVGSCALSLKINRCTTEDVGGKPYLVLGASFTKRDEVVINTISEYLLTFAQDCTVRSLREAGFNLQKSSEKFDFGYVKSQKDYDEVLDLRLEAYGASGKLPSSITRDYMRDEYDTRARILVVKVQGKIVGSARAMFHEKADKTSHERYLSFPKNFPKNEECLEVSRVCVLPDFQGIGLASELAKHLALLTIKSGRKYCYLSAAGDLINFWKQLGYQSTGTSYDHEDFGNLRHELLLNPIEDSILGKNIKAKNWHASYSALYDYCISLGFVAPDAFDEARIILVRLYHKLKKRGDDKF